MVLAHIQRRAANVRILPPSFPCYTSLNSWMRAVRLKLQDNAGSFMIGKVLNKAGYGKTPEVRMNFCITLPKEARRGTILSWSASFMHEA